MLEFRTHRKNALENEMESAKRTRNFFKNGNNENECDAYIWMEYIKGFCFDLQNGKRLY